MNIDDFQPNSEEEKQFPTHDSLNYSFISCRTRIIIICFFLASCSSSRMIETELYFGQTRPNGSLLTETEWNHFNDTQLSRVFKEGSTIIKATGNWYDPDSHKLITEPSYVVIYYHKKSPGISKQIDSLRTIYINLFQQQAVLRVDKKVKAGFKL